MVGLPDQSIKLMFQGNNSNVLHVGVPADEAKEGKFTLALALTNSRRDDMRIFVQLTSDLELVTKPIPNNRSQYKIAPEESFKGHGRKNQTSHVFGENGDVLFAVIPKVISGEEDNTNDAVFKWDFQVKGKLSATLEHKITAWVVTKGDDEHESEAINAGNPPTFKLFQLAPTVTRLALANKTTSAKNVVNSLTTWWVRDVNDAKLTGTVPKGTKFLAVQFSTDDINWSNWQNTMVTGETFVLENGIRGVALTENTAKDIQVKFSQTPDTEKATKDGALTAKPIPINVTYHAIKPTISAMLTDSDSGKLVLKLEAHSVGPALETLQYSTDAGTIWNTVSPPKTPRTTSSKEEVVLDAGDFSKGIKLRAEDQTGLTSEEPSWASISATLVTARAFGSNIPYSQPNPGSFFWVVIGPNESKNKLPPVQAKLTWDSELGHGAEPLLPANPTELSLFSTKYLTLNDAKKIWGVIPEPSVELTGAMGEYSPSSIRVPFQGNVIFHYIPESPDFSLDQIGGAFNSDHVVLSGRLNQVPSKPEDLIFEYTVDGADNYTALEKYQVTMTDSYFTLHLPETDFPDRSAHQPSIRVRYKHNAIEGLSSIEKVSGVIVVDNNLPAVTTGSITIDTKISANPTFKASGTIRQTTNTSNHITHYAMAWSGEEEGKIPAGNWIQITPNDAVKAVIHYEVTAQRNDIKGILQPKLLMKTVSGVVSDQHLYAQYAYGLIDIVTPAASGLVLDTSSPVHSFVFNVPRDKISDDDFNFDLTLPIQLFVGLSRVNVSAVLNDYSETAKLLLQDDKHLSAEQNLDSDSKRFIDNWGDETDTQLLSLSAQAKNTGYTIKFPLKIKKGTQAGDYSLTVSFKDVLRNAFSDITSVSIVFKVAA